MNAMKEPCVPPSASCPNSGCGNPACPACAHQFFSLDNGDEPTLVVGVKKLPLANLPPGAAPNVIDLDCARDLRAMERRIAALDATINTTPLTVGRLIDALSVYDREAPVSIFGGEDCDFLGEVVNVSPCGCDEPMGAALYLQDGSLLE